MIPSAVPPEHKNLTQREEMPIVRAFPALQLYIGTSSRTKNNSRTIQGLRVM